MNLILTEIDAAGVVGYIPTEEDLNNDDADFFYPDIPRGAEPVGDNGFVFKGIDAFKILTIDPDQTLHSEIFDLGPDWVGRSAIDSDFYLSSLDKNRVIALGQSNPSIYGTILSMVGGTPHATTTGQSGWPAGVTGRFFQLSQALDPNFDGSVFNPHTQGGGVNNNRWLPGPRTYWAKGNRGYGVSWISRNRPNYAGTYQDYEIYLLSFPLNDAEIPDLSATALLLPPAQQPNTADPVDGSWLSGNAYPLTDNAFFVADRIHTAERTDQGFRPDVTYLRAYDYSANLLATSTPLYTQTENAAGVGTFGSAQFARSADGTIVSMVQQDEVYPTRTAEGFQGYDRSTKFLMRRNTFTGSAWTLGAEKKVVDTGHTNGRSFVINFQEFQPGRFVIDAMQSDAAAGQYQVEHMNRVLTILDSKFNVTETVVVPPPTVKYPYDHPEANWYYATDHYWSSFAPGTFGLLGWSEYGDRPEQFSDIPKVMLVQHSPIIPKIDPRLSAELRDLGQRFISNTLSGMS